MSGRGAEAVPTRLGDLAVTTEGSGPVAVLWHSLYVDDRSWDALACEIRGDRTLVRITGPCHGESSPREDVFSLGDCAGAAEDVLTTLGIVGAVDWVGCAWGGHVGLVLASSRPSLVRSLVAFNSPVAALTAEESRTARLLALILRSIGPIPPAVRGLTNALLSETTLAQRPETGAYVAECLRRVPRRALVCAMESVSLGRADMTALLPGIAAPTLLVTSDDDRLWTPAQAEDAASRLQRGRSAVVPGTRHLTPYEDPRASARLLREHWTPGARRPPVVDDVAAE